MGTVWATSIYGMLHDRPAVEIHFDIPADEQTEPGLIQISPKEARAIAYSILEAAEAAETDAFVVRFFRQRIGLEMPEIAKILRDFRAARNQIDKEQPPPEQARQ